MHIQSNIIINLNPKNWYIKITIFCTTKCAKMTEENDSIKNGLNGGAVNTISYAKNETLSVQSKPTIKKDNTSNDAAALQQTTLSGKTNVSPTTVGGRLQFFKGTLILCSLLSTIYGGMPSLHIAKEKQ